MKRILSLLLTSILVLSLLPVFSVSAEEAVPVSTTAEVADAAMVLKDHWFTLLDHANKGEEEEWFKGLPAKGTEISLPHNPENRYTGSHVVWYYTKFTPDLNMTEDQRLIAYFEGLQYYAKIWLNGVYVGNHEGSHSKFSFDMTGLIREDQENLMVIRLYTPNNKSTVRGDTSGAVPIWDAQNCWIQTPVEIVDGPYMALRLMTEDNFLISKSPEGKLDRHQKGYDPMQWSANWKWNNEEHTQIKMSIGNGPAGYENFSKMLSTDWESLFPGAHIAIGGEENNAAVIENNGRMDNIRLVADERVRLIANAKLGTRDGCFIPLSKVDYTQKKLTGSARIINELQIRISFSESVEITDTPYISLRFIDEETNRVYYSGDEYNRAPVQFGGKWEWENDNHTSIIWTINSGNYFGPCNLYDVANYRYALELMTGRKIQLCIEEKSGKNISVGGGNGLVDNISTLDKKNHLLANVSNRGLLDGLYMDLNLGALRDLKPLTLVSATAINDQTIELKFSEPIMMSADAMPSVMLRYVSESGKADVLTNGKMANFKGDIAVKEGDPSVLVWTLNSKQVENLTDLFNYNGIFRWNNTSKLSLVISDAQEDAPPKTMRLLSIKALDGIRFLQAPYAVQPELMVDVAIGYDIPAPEQTTEAEQAPEIEYYSDYTQHIILGAALIAVGVVVLLIVCFKKKGGKA